MADIKLIHCNSCADIIRLYKTTRTCACGKSGGHYKEDGVQAIIWGNCKPLAFSLRTFSDAVQSQRTWGSGREFSAYVIPKVSPQIDHVDFELTNAAELAKVTKVAKAAELTKAAELIDLQRMYLETVLVDL